MSDHTERRLAAIVSADVVGYSRLMGRDDAGTLAALRDHRTQLFDPAIAEHGGRIVKTMGDGLLLEFTSVIDATRCAIAVQEGMTVRNGNVPAELARQPRSSLGTRSLRRRQTTTATFPSV